MPNGEFTGAIPRLVGPSEPPQVFGVDRPGSWLEYEAVFPDFFGIAPDQLGEGRYLVFWGTVARAGGRPHVLASDAFDWPAL